MNNFPAPSFLRRSAAIIYDSFLVLALWFVGVAFLSLLKFIWSGAPAEGERMLGGAWQIPTFITLVLIAGGFFCYFWTRNRQTLAMQTWRIEVVDDISGNNINLQQALIRFLAAFVSVACFGLGYLWMLVDKEKKTWHDHASGTRLILLPKRT